MKQNLIWYIVFCRIIIKLTQLSIRVCPQLLVGGLFMLFVFDCVQWCPTTFGLYEQHGECLIRSINFLPFVSICSFQCGSHCVVVFVFLFFALCLLPNIFPFKCIINVLPYYSTTNNGDDFQMLIYFEDCNQRFSLFVNDIIKSYI